MDNEEKDMSDEVSRSLDKNDLKTHLFLKNVSKRRERQAAQNKEKYREDSKKRLTEIVRQKITTSFIGAISAFEANFDFLWDDRIDFESLTIDQKDILGVLEEAGLLFLFKEMWSKARSEALCNGNDQLRAINKELEQHTVHWDRYSTEVDMTGTVKKNY